MPKIDLTPAAVMPLGKRKAGQDDAPSPVEIMQTLMDEMRGAFEAGDAAAVDRIYDRMVRQAQQGASASGV